MILKLYKFVHHIIILSAVEVAISNLRRNELPNLSAVSSNIQSDPQTPRKHVGCDLCKLIIDRPRTETQTHRRQS